MTIRFAPAAQEDLIDIWHFIAQDSMATADRVVDTFKDVCRQLTVFPERGRMREELAPGLRSLVVRKYRRYLILYRVQSDAVEIVRVLDGAQDLKSIFNRR